MIYLSYISYFILQKNIIRIKMVDSKIANKLQLEKRKQLEHKINSIIDYIALAKEVIDSRLSGLYYLIY